MFTNCLPCLNSNDRINDSKSPALLVVYILKNSVSRYFAKYVITYIYDDKKNEEFLQVRLHIDL